MNKRKDTWNGRGAQLMKENRDLREKLAEKDKEIERLNHEIERLKGPSQAERILATDRSNVIP